MTEPVDPGQNSLGSSLQIRIGGLRFASLGLTVGPGNAFVAGTAASSQADPGPDAVIYTPPTPPFGDPLESADGDLADAFNIPLTVT